jgi:hypothetical protein
MIPVGLCQCGCGGTTKISTYNSAKYGYVKGQPQKYMLGHTHKHSAEYNNARRSTRFWNKVELKNPTDCWIWIGAKNKWGYGHFWDGEHFEMAHRYAYKEKKGAIPEGLDLDHLCRNRLCVNPDHLEPVTRAENLRRGARTKLTLRQVQEIRNSSDTHAALAKEFGVDASTVCDIRHRRIWADTGEVANG